MRVWRRADAQIGDLALALGVSTAPERFPGIASIAKLANSIRPAVAPERERQPGTISACTVDGTVSDEDEFARPVTLRRMSLRSVPAIQVGRPLRNALTHRELGQG